MIERKFVAQNMKEMQIHEYIKNNLDRIGLSYIKLQKTPLGEKIIICAARPGLVVGKAGSNISKLTRDLKEKFALENPQIELVDVENPQTDAHVVAENIASSLERFGTNRFKGIGHKAMTEALNNGAVGIEILISGKIPSSRAKIWRFYMGYLKKCGDIAVSGVDMAYAVAKLKTGIVGVQVRIMPSSVELPDKIVLLDDVQIEVQEVNDKKEAEKIDAIVKEVEKKEKKPRARKPRVKKEETEQ